MHPLTSTLSVLSTYTEACHLLVMYQSFSEQKRGGLQILSMRTSCCGAEQGTLRWARIFPHLRDPLSPAPSDGLSHHPALFGSREWEAQVI